MLWIRAVHIPPDMSRVCSGRRTCNAFSHAQVRFHTISAWDMQYSRRHCEDVHWHRLWAARTKVVITMQPELDFMRLEQVIKCFCERWGTRPQYSSFTLFKAQKFILEIHVKRCLAQTRLVAELKTSKGQATFAALLHGMPRLDGLGLQNVDFIDSELAAEYFNGSFSNKRPHVSSMYSHQHLIYCDVVPLILPHLHHFTNLALDADGSIFDRASSTNIMSQSLSNPDGGLMNSAFRIKKINITLTRQEAMLKGDTHRPYDLGGAAAFATMLSLAVNLEELSLRCPVGSMEDYVRLLDARAYQGLGNASWLNRVLQDQHWPKLRSIEIVKFYCDSNALLSFFDAHQPSLLDVKFRKCRVASEYNLFEVVESMRKRLNLVDCSIGMIPDIRSAASFGLRWAFQYLAIPDPTYFNPKDPFKLRADPEMNNDDSERETMAAKVLAHYVLFAKPDWDAYAKVVGLQQDRSWMRGSIP